MMAQPEDFQDGKHCNAYRTAKHNCQGNLLGCPVGTDTLDKAADRYIPRHECAHKGGKKRVRVSSAAPATRHKIDSSGNEYNDP